MKYVYKESIEKEIVAAVKQARADGKRICEVILSPEEYSELRATSPDVKKGEKFKGCLITVEGE
jgi:hypothetical protein